jgi:hypothetical protein
MLDTTGVAATCVAPANTPSLSIQYNGRNIGNSVSGQGGCAAKVR